MKKNEIKTMVEQVVRVEYIAEDGQVFYNEEECRKYEESALFAVSHKLKRLTNKWTSICTFNDEGSEDCELEIFDVQTATDLENLRRYLYLKATQNGANDTSVQPCFTSVDGTRKNYVFDNVTIGHEVMIFWSYDNSWFWVYKDGSLNGYFEWLKEQYANITAPKEDEGV